MSGVLEFEALALGVSKELAAVPRRREAAANRVGLLLVLGRSLDHDPQTRGGGEALTCLLVLGAALSGELMDRSQSIGGRTELVQRDSAGRELVGQ